MTTGLKMKYFVLKPNGTDPYAVASRAALLAYAGSIEVEDQEFAMHLRHWHRTAEFKCRADNGEFDERRVQGSDAG